MSTHNNENSSTNNHGFPIPNFDDIDDVHEEREITDDEKKKKWAPDINASKRNYRKTHSSVCPDSPYSHCSHFHAILQEEVYWLPLFPSFP